MRIRVCHMNSALLYIVGARDLHFISVRLFREFRIWSFAATAGFDIKRRSFSRFLCVNLTCRHVPFIALETLVQLSLADVSKYKQLYSAQNWVTSTSDISCICIKSHLLATSASVTFSSVRFDRTKSAISFNFSKLDLSVIEYTSMIASAHQNLVFFYHSSIFLK